MCACVYVCVCVCVCVCVWGGGGGGGCLVDSIPAPMLEYCQLDLWKQIGILIQINTFCFWKMLFKMSSGKLRQCSLGLNV